MIINGTLYNDKTPIPVVDILERYHNNYRFDHRLRLFYGDSDTGRDWGEEYDTTGYIGRSTGTSKLPLLIHNARSLGGGAILDNRIVKIIDCTNHRVLYQHPLYNQPEYTLIDSDLPEYTAAVLADGQLVARFHSKNQAANWIAYMTGKRMSK